jgi:3',5'-cyclic AMP phosphodiesterase CpdA
MYKKILWVCIVWTFALQAAEGLYLTYPKDPSSSMAIHWFESEKNGLGQIAYKTKDGELWQHADCEQKAFGCDFIKSSVLEGLLPDTEYVFQWPDKEHVCCFKTLPKTLLKPISIAIGGDAYQQYKPFHKMNEQVASKSPDFVILGGDIAYANTGNPYKRWKEFFCEWHKAMISSEGRIIPLVACVGNHDTSKKGTLFLQLFPYLQQGSYGTLEVAKDTLFVLLDTQHIAKVQGGQQVWLKNVLEEKKDFHRKFAVYHIAAYPSTYSYNDKVPRLIRSYWCPLFEEYGITACFENHNHAYKRTYPIRAGKIDPKGIVYIGDGAWSVSPRKIRKNLWYLQEKKSSQYVCLLTLSNAEIAMKMIDAEGQLLDELKITAAQVLSKFPENID